MRHILMSKLALEFLLLGKIRHVGFDKDSKEVNLILVLAFVHMKILPRLLSYKMFPVLSFVPNFPIIFLLS